MSFKYLYMGNRRYYTENIEILGGNYFDLGKHSFNFMAFINCDSRSVIRPQRQTGNDLYDDHQSPVHPHPGIRLHAGTVPSPTRPGTGQLEGHLRIGSHRIIGNRLCEKESQ